jgi:hypothetical protein
MFLALLVQAAIAGTVCNDGTVSESSGRGTCSHHGGVAGIVPEQTHINFDDLRIQARASIPDLHAFFERGDTSNLTAHTYDELVERLISVEDLDFINTLPFVDIEIALAITGKRMLKVGKYELAVMNKDSNSLQRYHMLVIRHKGDTLMIRDPSTTYWGSGSGFSGGFGGGAGSGGFSGRGGGAHFPFITEAWRLDLENPSRLPGVAAQDIMEREFKRMHPMFKPNYCPANQADYCAGGALPDVTIYPLDESILKNKNEEVFLVTNYESDRTQLSNVFVGYMKLIEAAQDWGSRSLLSENWNLIEPIEKEKDICAWGPGRCADRKEPGEWDDFSM